MIGERFQHGEARGFLAIGHVAVERNDFRGGVLLVDKGAFQREIDKAADDLAGKCRDLPQDQFGSGGALQQIEHVVHTGIGLVDFVQEKQPRDFLLLKLTQDELELWNFFLVHFADDHRDIDRRQHRTHVMDEFDRAGTIEKCVGVAHEVRGGDRELDAHAVIARFLAAVADRVAGFDTALARNGASAGEDRFEQCRLAALEGTDQRDTAGSGRTRCVIAVCCHDCLPAPARRRGAGSALPSFQAAAGLVKGRDTAPPGRRLKISDERLIQAYRRRVPWIQSSEDQAANSVRNFTSGNRTRIINLLMSFCREARRGWCLKLLTELRDQNTHRWRCSANYCAGWRSS